MRSYTYVGMPATVYHGVDPWAPFTEYNALAMNLQEAYKWLPRRELGHQQPYKWQQPREPPTLCIQDKFRRATGSACLFDVVVTLECGTVLWTAQVGAGVAHISCPQNVPILNGLGNVVGYLRQIIRMEMWPDGGRCTVRVGWIHASSPKNDPRAFMMENHPPRLIDDFEATYHVIAPNFEPIVVSVGALRIHVHKPYGL